METTKYNISSTTSKFIQALRTLMTMETLILEGFWDRYGDDSQFEKSKLPELIDNLKDEIKKTIGTSIEVSMGENWKPDANEIIL